MFLVLINHLFSSLFLNTDCTLSYFSQFQDAQISYTIDPWTTQVWTAQVHLHTEFFFLKVNVVCVFSFYQIRSVTQSCPTLCDPMNHSTPGLPVYHQLPESTQTHVHWVSDAIQPSHPLSSPSPPALSLSQHQGLFKWVSSSHEVAKILEFQL